MENLDPASVETQQTVVSEIFRSAGDEKSLTLGLLLKAYDVVIAKHGINATDLVGIQIYRSLLHWGRGRDRCDRDRPVAATAVRQPLAPLDPEPLWDPRPSQGPLQWMRPVVKAVLPEPVVQLEASLMTFPPERQPRPETIKTLRKVMDAWVRQVHETREMLLQERHQMKRWRCRRSMDSWKAVIARRRMLKEQQLEVLSQREQQTKADTFQHWKHRTPQAPEAPAAPTPELDVLLASVAFWKRCCRRAMDAWLLVVQWEALAARLQRNSSFQLLSAVFQVWVEQWHEDRKEAALLQRATVFRRKQGQLLGLQSLRWNVILAHRTRAFLEAQSQLEEGLRMRQRRALEVCWSAMSRYVEQRRLMKLYRNWADVHWLRTRLGAAWQVWFAWHQKRGKVVAMRSSAQILASWHWLRVHAAAHPERFVARSSARVPHAPWWHAAAADLLFSPAPFEIHPHHMKALRQDSLVLFANALLKRMIHAWMQQARDMQEVFRQAKLRTTRRCVDAWKGAATRCRRLRKLLLQVSHQRSQQMTSQALQHCANRWSNLVQHQQNLREFDVACWHRSCRRAMDAWLLARQWEVRVAQQLKSSKLQLQRQIFEAWKTTWKAERKEALLLLQSDRLQRQLRLRRSFRVLLWHAEHRQGQMGWIKRWWILAHLSRRSREVEALQQKAENFANHKNRQLILALLSTWHIFAGARQAACRAGQSVRKRHQQVLLLKWRNSFEAREAARVAKCQQAVKHSLLLRSFAGWAMWYRRNLSIRQFASKVFSRLRRNALTLSIHAWAKVARELAARETRYLLQVNDFQRKHKRQAHLLLIQAWHREAKASADATRTARLRKVFACWRLASQE